MEHMLHKDALVLFAGLRTVKIYFVISKRQAAGRVAWKREKSINTLTSDL